MMLSAYHQKYDNLPDIEIQNRVNEKKQELSEIFAQAELKTTDKLTRVAVVGCGDKRFIKHHKVIFESMIKSPVEITTFDIVVDHLENEANVFQHDCTLPLPYGPYDITYAHVLLKFIETEKQCDLILNSYYALKYGGHAIHVLDKEEYETNVLTLPNGQFAVPLERWKKQLEKMHLEYKEIPIKYGLALVILKK